MSTIAEEVLIRASLAEAWDYYFDPATWPAWVDGFGRVESESGYPDVGGSLRWRSGSAGRGEVTERVVEHEPRRVHAVSFQDPDSSGTLRTSFAIQGEATLVSQTLDYKLRQGGPLAKLTDRLFIRSQMRGSVGRSLARLKLELEEVAAGPQPV
jgi:hypothetical protein